MAPEVIRLEKEMTAYNERADIWSFGMIIYEVLTFDLPYSNDHDVDFFNLYDHIKAGKRPTFPKHMLWTEIETELRELFWSCTHKIAGARPSTSSLLSVLTQLKDKK